MAPPDSAVLHQAEAWAAQQQVKFTGNDWEDLARAAEELSQKLDDNSLSLHHTLPKGSLGSCTEGEATRENIQNVASRSKFSILSELQQASALAKEFSANAQRSHTTLNSTDENNSQNIRQPR